MALVGATPSAELTPLFSPTDCAGGSRDEQTRGKNDNAISSIFSETDAPSSEAGDAGSPLARLGPQGDEPSAALVGQVGPCPAQRNDEAIAQSDKEVDMGDAPDKPADKPGELYTTYLHHRRLAANGGEVAFVTVGERRQHSPGEAGEKRVRGVAGPSASRRARCRDGRPSGPVTAAVSPITNTEDRPGGGVRATRERARRDRLRRRATPPRARQ